jgi:hypothetical protein
MHYALSSFYYTTMDSQQIRMPHHMVLIRWVFAILAVMIVGSVFFGGYGGLQKLIAMVPGGSSDSAGMVPKDLQGMLLLSVGRLSTTTGKTIGIVPLEVTVRNGSVSYTKADQLKDGPAIALQYSMSSDSGSAVFLATPIASTSNGTSTAAVLTPSIYRADTNGTKDPSLYSNFIAALQGATPVSKPSDADYFPDFPVIFTNQAVLYSSLSKALFTKSGSAIQNIPADSWSIYEIAPDGTKTALTTGLRPKWIDATHFAFLKNDGVYLYDLTNASEKKVWEISHMATAVMGFDVSDDSQFAILTDPSDGSAEIIRVLNWTGGVMSSLVKIPVTASNPAFAPDDTYVAMVVLRQNPADPAAKLIPAIQYYSLASQQFLSYFLPFDPATTGAIYLTDWR